MATATPDVSVLVNKTEFENLIRRAVRDAVREEFTRLIRIPNRSILEYWEHEGPDDAAGDEELLADALALIQEYERNSEGWMTLEEFEAELSVAEAANELPGWNFARSSKRDQSAVGLRTCPSPRVTQALE